MNKKLFLIPITLMSCFMSACTIKTEHVTLDEILSYTDEGHGYYFVYGIDEQYSTYYDLEHGVANIIKENLGEAEFVAKADGLSKNNSNRKVQYHLQLDTPHHKMDYFTIYIYEDGMIDACSIGSGWPISPMDQYTTYRIDKENASKIIDKTIERKQEVQALLDAERKEAEEYATFENFFAEYAKQENKMVYYYYLGPSNGYRHLNQYSHCITDKDGDISEDLMGLEYQFVEGYLEVDTNNDAIGVSAKDRWNIYIDTHRGNGYMCYVYQSAYTGHDTIEKYFTVNKEKLDALNDKLSKIVEKETKESK